MSVLATMSVATLINTASTVKKGKDPIPTLLAAAVYTTFLAYLQDSVDDRLASVLAGIFLLGTFMIHAATFTDLIGYLTTPKDSVK